MEFEDRALDWVLAARRLPLGAVVAGLLWDLATGPRWSDPACAVRFPLHPAARALGAAPVIVRTALQRLSEAGMLRLTIEGPLTREPWVTATLLLLPPTGPGAAGAGHGG
ncbi:hypothetical protein ACIOD1_11835 [Streptomyces sp. NPDC088097]|uniref:hypothetical protein n=1 Tax=Streptomyces sp. NPDC088097 TaxID=3365823 RepID=UPI00382A8BC9